MVCDKSSIIKCAKIGGGHLKYVNNHFAKFEYKGMKTLGVTDKTQITQCEHPKGGVDVIVSKLNTPKNIIKCTQNKRGTS